MAFFDFYITPSGSNLNSGSTLSAPKYTSLAGNWVSSTGVFTPTDGSIPSNSVQANVDWVSLYLNGNTLAPYVALVTAVGSGVNGAITLSQTNFLGIVPGNQTGTANVIDGGAWANLEITFSGGPLYAPSLNSSLLAQSTRINIQAGMYTPNTDAYTIYLSGTSKFTFWFRGFKNTPGDQEANFNPVMGVDVPLFTFTTGGIYFRGQYTRISCLAIIGGNTSNSTGNNWQLGLPGSHNVMYLVTSINTGTGYAVALSGATVSVFSCYFQAASTEVVSVDWAYQTFQGNVVAGGTYGIACNNITAPYVNINIVNNVFFGQSSDSIYINNGGIFSATIQNLFVNIINNSFYNINGNGVTLAAPATITLADIYACGNYFSGMPPGFAAFNNTTTFSNTLKMVGNRYAPGVTPLIGGGDMPAVFDHGDLPSEAFVAPAAGNFNLNRNGWGAGFPFAFLNAPILTPFPDTGAIQHGFAFSSNASYFEQALNNQLQGIAPLVALLGSIGSGFAQPAIFKTGMPETWDLGANGPALTYTVPTKPRGQVLVGADETATARVQLDVWSYTAGIPEMALYQIFLAINAMPGTWGIGCVIMAVVHQGDTDADEPPKAGTDQWIYHSLSEYMIQYRLTPEAG